MRVRLRALHARFGNWRNVERSLPVAHSVMVDVMSERVEVSVVIAFRVAKVLGASIYDVIAGRALPDGTCAHCGKEPGDSALHHGIAMTGSDSFQLVAGPVDHGSHLKHLDVLLLSDDGRALMFQARGRQADTAYGHAGHVSRHHRSTGRPRTQAVRDALN